jgi:hypothetical protein
MRSQEGLRARQKIEAALRASKLDGVKYALVELGISGMTIALQLFDDPIVFRYSGTCQFPWAHSGVETLP